MSPINAGDPEWSEDGATPDPDSLLDINDLLVKHPGNTVYVTCKGDSMEHDIRRGDILVVDTLTEPRNGQVVIAFIDRAVTVKILRTNHGYLRLCSKNEAYPPIEIKPGEELRIWGVVTWTIRQQSTI